jgi:cation:H+ antiporter
VLSSNSTLGRVEGATLFAGVVLYTFMNYYWSRKDVCDVPDERACALAGEVEEIGRVTSRPKQLLMIGFGIAGVIGGAELVVDSAVVIMTVLGVSEKFIGLTIVAFGTSLPELATSVVAAIRKEMDISIGNLVGSNVFNLLSVLGLAAMVRPIIIPGGFYASGLWFDYAVMLFISALPWWMMRKTATISRANGAVLLGCYLLYLSYLVAGA